MEVSLASPVPSTSPREQPPSRPAGNGVDAAAQLADIRSCFVCLQTPEESPGEAWVTACPCTLDAHEACMLRWIAETEAGSGGKKGVRCPACKAPIRIEEPHDAFVELADRGLRAYRRAAPWLLLYLTSGIGAAASAAYGAQAMGTFAGWPRTAAWLFPPLPAAVPWSSLAPPRRFTHGFTLLRKLFVLQLVLPALLLQRVVPSLATLLATPVCFVYSSYLISQHSLPTWPPSPEWAIVFMPWVHFTYSSVYYNLFGKLEKRLNLALRGRPAEPAAAEGEGQAEDQNPPNGAGFANQERQAPQEGGEGIGAVVRRARNALMNILGNGDELMDVGDVNGVAAALVVDDDGNGIQLEIEIEADGDDADGDDAAEILGIRANGENGHDHEEDAERELRHAHRELQDEELVIGADGELVALLPPDIPRGRRPGLDGQGAHGAAANGVDDNGNNRNGNGNANADAPAPAEANRGGGGGGGIGLLFSDIIAAVTTQLFLPHIAATFGSVLYYTLPRAWVRRSPWQQQQGLRSGLLHERWGRSLAGGFLFIVLRDMWSLYAKYRRVQVKQNRKIKNVYRNRVRQNGEANSAEEI